MSNKFFTMETNSESRKQLEHARDNLVAMYIYDPDVTLIDIGYPLANDQEIKKLVLRIHVKSRWMKSSPEQRTEFPKEFDGIPVIVMSGDYKLE